MPSSIKKRSVAVGRRKTSISLENEFWDALNQITAARDTTLSSLLASIAADRPNTRLNLSSAVRVFILDHYRNGG